MFGGVFLICQDLTEFGFSLGIHQTEGPVPTTQATSWVSQFLRELQDPLQPKFGPRNSSANLGSLKMAAKKLRNTSGKVSNKLPAAFLLRILRLEDVSSGNKNQKHMLTRSFEQKYSANSTKWTL